jgi:hypothetical protein
VANSVPLLTGRRHRLGTGWTRPSRLPFQSGYELFTAATIIWVVLNGRFAAFQPPAGREKDEEGGEVRPDRSELSVRLTRIRE